jgi:hypothetical protein
VRNTAGVPPATSWTWSTERITSLRFSSYRHELWNSGNPGEVNQSEKKPERSSPDAASIAPRKSSVTTGRPEFRATYSRIPRKNTSSPSFPRSRWSRTAAPP